MKPLTTIVEHYEVHSGQVWGHPLKVITYQLGEKYVCIIESIDPGATICRVSAKDRMMALRLGFTQAKRQIAPDVPVLGTPSTCELKPNDERAEQIREIVLDLDGSRASLTIEEFMALPLAERMKMILNGCATFLADNGSAIPSGKAIELLRSCAPA